MPLETLTAVETCAASRPAARVAPLVEELCRLSIGLLPQMFVPQAQRFCFTLRRRGNGLVAEGTSDRYTAITLLGLAQMATDHARALLGGQSPQTLADELAQSVGPQTGLGDAALIHWAQCEAGGAHQAATRRCLLARLERRAEAATVELAWALAALTADESAPAKFRTSAADRLCRLFRPAGGLFPHGEHRSWLRGHVACFADQVYPIHALARFAASSGDQRAIDIAITCAQRTVKQQGPQGQWWWHFDVRSGGVIERYPVYAVHQTAMAPLALLALHESGGPDFLAAVARGLGWLARSTELGGGSLIDRRRGLIWRKVARREPGKLARSAQAIFSRAHARLRAPLVDRFLPPGEIDFETRPYHYGWLLHVWTPQRIEALRQWEEGSE